MKLAKRCLPCQQRLLKTHLRNIAAGSSRENNVPVSMPLACSWISATVLHASRNVLQEFFSTTIQNGMSAMITRGTAPREFAEHTKPESVSLRAPPNESPENSLVISGSEELTW